MEEKRRLIIANVINKYTSTELSLRAKRGNLMGLLRHPALAGFLAMTTYQRRSRLLAFQFFEARFGGIIHKCDVCGIGQNRHPICSPLSDGVDISDVNA